MQIPGGARGGMVMAKIDNCIMTLVPTYTFVGNLFQAFVMYARVGLRGSRRFGLVLTGTLTQRLARNRRSMFADMQQIQNVNTEMKPNMHAMTFEDSVKISKIIIW